MNRLLLTLSLLFTAAAALADDVPGLLPVEQAFRVEGSAPNRQSVKFEFKIAKDYYLYRNQIKTKAITPGLTLEALDLPAGEQKHDEFLGDVEVYHQGLVATQHLKAPADVEQIAIELRYQGCHQVDPKICFPPQKVTQIISLPKPPAPAAAPAEPPAPSALTNAMPTPGPSLLGGDQPLPAEQAFVYEAIATGPNEILARFTMPKGYYLYRDKTKFSTTDKGVTLGTPKWPTGKEHTDENFGKTTVYFDQVEIPVPVTRANTAAQTLALSADFQGCKEGSICYPLMTRVVDVSLPAGAATAAPPTGTREGASSAASSETQPALSEEQQLAARLSGSRLFALLSFFGFGLLLAFTPCVFPMIPILSGIIAGAGANISTQRAFVLSVIYVLASCVVFTIAGVAAGLAGESLQVIFQAPWILLSFSGLFVILSLSMFGFYELQLPNALQSKIASFSNRQQGGSLLGVAIMGLFSALIVGPCVAPPLAAAVLYIADTHDPVFGGAALFVLSLGMGAPLVAVGTGAGWLLPRAGVWMNTVKAVFGVVFLWMAIWIASRVLSEFKVDMLSAALLTGSAVYMGAVDRLPENASGWRKLWKALGLMQFIVGAAMLAALGYGIVAARSTNAAAAPTGAQPVHAVEFKRIKSEKDFDREVAAAAGRPVMLDFYADWCVSCKEMEKFTFSRPEVQKELEAFVSIQADVTANDDVDQALMKRFGIIAPPDTLFFGPDGKEKRALRLTGPEDADKFLARMEMARK
jgi:thiol:disulfide interchange protein DsbD